VAIYRRGNIFWYDFTFKGKRYRDSTHAANKRVAEQVVAGFKAALAKDELGIIEKKPAPIFSAFWKQALDEIKGDALAAMARRTLAQPVLLGDLAAMEGERE